MPPVVLIWSTTMSTPMRSRAPSIAPVPVMSSRTPILMGAPVDAEDEVVLVALLAVVGWDAGAGAGAVEQPATSSTAPSAAGSTFKGERTRTYASNVIRAELESQFTNVAH